MLVSPSEVTDISQPTDTECPHALLHIGDQTFTLASLVESLRQYGLLPQLVQELIIERAIAPVELSPEESQMALQRFNQRNGIQNEAMQKAWLEQQRMSEDDYARLAFRAVRLDKFKHERWGHTLETAFLRNKEQFDRVIYSLLRTRDAGLAQELYFRILEGENSFGELAKQFSEGPEAETQGLIGPVELTKPHPQLAQMLRRCQPGQLLPPTLIGEWFLIVRLEKFVPAQFDAMTQQVLLEEQYRGWLNQEIAQALQTTHLTEGDPS
jgi:parvulin-like peptidyl-prolyl isomerase